MERASLLADVMEWWTIHFHYITLHYITLHGLTLGCWYCWIINFLPFGGECKNKLKQKKPKNKPKKKKKQPQRFLFEIGITFKRSHFSKPSLTLLSRLVPTQLNHPQWQLLPGLSLLGIPTGWKGRWTATKLQRHELPEIRDAGERAGLPQFRGIEGFPWHCPAPGGPWHSHLNSVTLSVGKNLSMLLHLHHLLFPAPPLLLVLAQVKYMLVS